MRRAIALLALFCVCDAVKFGQFCDGNPTNRMRNDNQGLGHYGARRSNSAGKHEGIDIECADGSVVRAPFDVTIQRKLIVYANPTAGQRAINSGVVLRGEGLCFKVFYVAADSASGTVSKGRRIGVMLPMQDAYPGMTSHIHVQMCDKSDPTQYF